MLVVKHADARRTHPLSQIRVDVTVSGSIFSGDGLLYNHSTLPSALADNFMDYNVDATLAIYTVVNEVGAGKLYLVRGLFQMTRTGWQMHRRAFKCNNQTFTTNVSN